VGLSTYLQQFEWDEAKYKLSSPLKDIVEAISLTISKLDEELKANAGAYQSIVHAIAAEKRKATGNLMVRDLIDIIKGEEVVDTEYLTTLFVVVPKGGVKEFLATYEELVEDVVPRSSNLLHTDSDFHLYSVILFKKRADDFKTAARANRWTIREWKADAKPTSNTQDDAKKQEIKRVKHRNNLIRWCRLNFAEAFIGWTHLKTVRVFVETVLRYGLPADFTAVVMEPHKNSDGKLRKSLDSLYESLGSVYLQETEDDSLSAFTGTDKFYSYVFTKMHIGTGAQ